MLSKPSKEMPKPPQKEQLSNNSPNTLLIIIIVILVGIIGVAAGYILFRNANIQFQQIPLIQRLTVRIRLMPLLIIRLNQYWK